MSYDLWLSPPVAFLVLLAVILALSALASRLSFRPKDGAKASTKAYAGGENMPDHMIQPDYSQFFPFAFYFTILHVVALMATTVPTASLGTFLIAVVYIMGAVVGLFVLYRR
jgi:NADH:ubiquinone oxidoreductase subunit 3 (subunit A)